MVGKHLDICICKSSIIINSLQSGQDPKDKNILAWADKNGEFKRQQSQFRNFIENKPGAQFPPEKDRYHLYVSYACPWGEQ
jgi:glutathionyl-hydroquinone reductase